MKLKTFFFNLFRTFFKVSLLEQWLRKKTLEKETSFFFSKLIPNNYQYTKNTRRTFNYEGVHLEADISDYVGHYLYFGFKDIGHEKLMDLTQPNDVILDIGTNIGSTLLQFANKIGENGKVYGFEPDPINYNACTHNMALNYFKNIEVANIGLGNEKGEFNLVVDTETNRGGNRISFSPENEKPTSIIQVERLDDWIKDKPIKKVDLIKIDVEGFELQVLKGAEETLKEYNPQLFIELDDNNLKAVGNSAKELINFLKDLNYKVVHAENNENINSNCNFNNCHFDIIAKYDK